MTVRRSTFAYHFIVTIVMASLPCEWGTADEPEKPDLKPLQQQMIELHGWKTWIDSRLLPEGAQSPGKKRHAAVEKLERDLAMVCERVPEPALADLKKYEIQLDFDHPWGDKPLLQAQYHPSGDWLKEHGYDERLTRRVHIPNAKYYLEEPFVSDQPLAVLHELAHALHDQKLDFGNKEVAAVFERYKASGRGDEVLFCRGDEKRKHYALTNPMEFFAEMTEAYFGGNDFFPFNAEELEASEPETFALMERLWGKPKGEKLRSSEKR
jgi:hypothetical protein